MATLTLGTDATNSLDALAFSPVMTQADFASLQNAVKYDNAAQATLPGAFTRSGLLFVPRRGVLKVLDGDYVGVDAQGWPILISAYSIGHASSDWTHS